MASGGSGNSVSSLQAVSADRILLHGLWGDQSPASVFSGALDSELLLSSGCGRGDTVFMRVSSVQYPGGSDQGKDPGAANPAGSSMDSDRNHGCAVVNQKWSFLFYRRESDLIPIE